MTEETAVRRGLIGSAQMQALAGLLDLEEAARDALPALWHWTQLLEAPAQSALGPDGHPLRSIPSPPGEGRKRMFAGGRVRTYELLRTDVHAERTTTLVDSVTKQGRSGSLTFVTVRHSWTQGRELCVVEDVDIVYRDAGSSLQVTPGTLDLPGPDVGDDPVVRVVADESFLFRFSALTYNAHRIHYDLDWARHEGYPGLVVHGPLQALLMGELYRRYGGGLVGHEFSYRLKAPMVGSQPVTAVAGPDGLEHGVRVLDVFGTVTAVASVTPLPED